MYLAGLIIPFWVMVRIKYVNPLYMVSIQNAFLGIIGIKTNFENPTSKKRISIKTCISQIELLFWVKEHP